METLQGAGGLRPLQLSQPFRGSFNFADLSRNSGPQTCQFSTTKSSVWNFRRTHLSLNLCPSSEILAEEKKTDWGDFVQICNFAAPNNKKYFNLRGFIQENTSTKHPLSISVWSVPSVWNCSPRYFLGMTYSIALNRQWISHTDKTFFKTFLLEYALDTIPPRQDLMLPSLGGICMTPCHSFCLRKGVLACFDLPSMLGALVKTGWRLKRRMTMKSQTHERRLEFSGAVAGAQKNLGLWTCGLQKLMCSFRAVMPNAKHARRRCGCTTCTYTVVYRLHES